MSDVTKDQLVEVTFLVPGLMCNGCAEKVRDAVMGIPGVRRAKPSAWRKRVTVYFEARQVGPDQIKSVLEDAGFEVGNVQG